MKKIYFLIFIVATCLSGISQDTLFTKAGNTINCKVLEVRATEVKYKSQSEVDKQISSIQTSELSSIHYKNGTKDIFETLNDSTSFRSTIVDGRKVPNQPGSINYSNEELKRAERNADIADGVILGLRVVGFILRVALEVAIGGNCSGGHSSHSSSSGGHPRGH